MLSSKNRFHRRNHVQYVHRAGKSVRGGRISLRYVRGQRHTDFRAAVVVSKKVDKRAAVRNRIRRRIYAYLRTLQPAISPDVDVVLSVFDKTVATVSPADLKKELDDLIERSRLQNETNP